MEVWLWVLIGILALVIVILTTKIYLLRKSAREIEGALAEKLTTDTNTLIDLTGNDRSMRDLANSINIQLRELRAQRHRFEQGNTELKNAVTNISHDLRTPLTAICGYLDLLEQEEKSETVKRYVNVIRDRVEILTQLTEELFRYSVILAKDRETIREPVVINGVLEDSIAAFYTALKDHDILPHIQITEQNITRFLDRSALQRVFANLLNNAMKYSDGDLDITLSETGEMIFSNTAPGLDEIQVGRLFERFFTVESAEKSTGLGLAIARTLVEQMNGTISAQYEDNRLSIRVFFPDAAKAAK